VLSERLVRSLAAALLVLGTTAPADAGAAQPERAPPGAIDRFVQGWMAANGVPGLALALTRDTRVVHLRGYGDAGNGRPVTPDTQFLVASLSKSFTALAVLQLAEAGRINLDAPVAAYLPGFTVADPAGARRITVRMLLNQTSGMADTGFPEMTLPQPTTIADRVASLRTARLLSEPGTAFHYFNPNYAVLTRLVEVASGRPFPEYLRAHLFAPLAMTATTSVLTAAQAPSAAPGLAQGHLLAFGLPIAHDEFDGYLGGSGGVISTARDMASWLIVHNQRGNFQGRRLLSPRGIELLHTPPRGIDTSYAMGWTSQPGAPPVLEHSGVLSTFYAHQALLPRGRYGIVFLANAYSGLVDFTGLRRGLTALLATDGGPHQGFGARRIGIALTGVAALIVVVGAWRLRRLPRWRRQRAARPWRAVLGIAVPFAPTLLTLLVPTLVARLSGRVFSWRALFFAVPDLLGCLVLAALLGATLGTARAVALISHTRPMHLRLPTRPGGSAGIPPGMTLPSDGRPSRGSYRRKAEP
jgi:CubicO group peptidase (beta-lactamase class C family)